MLALSCFYLVGFCPDSISQAGSMRMKLHYIIVRLFESVPFLFSYLAQGFRILNIFISPLFCLGLLCLREENFRGSKDGGELWEGKSCGYGARR
jgi:hypothetical protein